MNWKNTLLLAASVVLGTQAIAQIPTEDAAKERVIRVQSDLARIEVQRVDAEAEMVDVEVEMRVAERRLAEAARRIGELSSRQLRGIGSSWNFDFNFDDRPVMGITIGARSADGAVEGVEVIGVSPGGAADEAGLRAGDVITSLNNESLSDDSAEGAGKKLLDFLSGVEEGDTLDVEYIRAGKVAVVEVSPRRTTHRIFEFIAPGSDLHFPSPPDVAFAPRAEFERFVFMSGAGGWGDMEMVELTEDLGRYFGTSEGFLVVSAPEEADLKLKDGDVIQSIDGRTPKSVSHTIRILSSYQSGEELEIKIMRDKRSRTLKIEMPGNRSSRIELFGAPHIESKIHIVPLVKKVPASDRT